MMETHEEKVKRIGDAVELLMNYDGTNYGMRCAQKLIRDLGYTVQDVHHSEYEDGDGKWRLWKIVPPNALEPNFIWAQPIEDIRGKIEVKVGA